MPITGLTAFRTNRFEGKKVVSPLRKTFEWNSRTVWAELCSCCPRVALNPDEPEVEVMSPREEGRCGIYATLNPEEVHEYMSIYSDGALMLVEAVGDYIVHYDSETLYKEGGFRASGVQIVAVVNTSPNRKSHIQPAGSEIVLDRKSIMIQAAARKYDVKIISLEDAIEVCKIMWNKINPELPWVFDELRSLYVTKY